MKNISKNTLFYGDNLEILRERISDETVDLCYIDPPFNSKRTYNQIYLNIGEDKAQAQAFVDTWKWDTRAVQGYQEIITNHDGRFTAQITDLLRGLRSVIKEGPLLAYLVSMTLRITEIQRVLKKTGSFYLHCDPTASHYLKLVLDAVFCAKGGDYLNEIVWKRTNVHSHAAQGTKHFSRINDSIFLYSKSNERCWNQLYIPHSEQHMSKSYKYVEEETGRRYALSDLTVTDGGLKGNPIFEFLGVTRYWRYNKEKMEKLLSEGRIVQKSSGTVPRYKRYLDESAGVEVSSIWTDINPIAAQAAERLGYPTQKPEALLERIVQASSNQGDLVLDAYCGCGTSVAVAQRLKRKWIGIDITYQSISLILRRLEDTFGKKILNSLILDGIPQDMESARALANKKDDRLRKEFEKWAVLTYSENRAVINEKKGADRGIDGTAWFLSSPADTEKMVFQVKSGKVGRADIAAFISDMNSADAKMGVFLTLEEPTEPMRKEAAAAGMYEHPLMGKSYPRVQIVTVWEIIEEKKRADLSLGLEVLKSAKAKSGQLQKQIHNPS